MCWGASDIAWRAICVVIACISFLPLQKKRTACAVSVQDGQQPHTKLWMPVKKLPWAPAGCKPDLAKSSAFVGICECKYNPKLDLLHLIFTGAAEISSLQNISLHFIFTSSPMNWSLYVQAWYSQEYGPSALLSFSLLSYWQGHFLTFISSVICSSYTCFDAIDFISVSQIPKGFFSEPAKHAAVRHHLAVSS